MKTIAQRVCARLNSLARRDKEHITFDAVNDIQDVQLIGRSRISGEKREFTFICRDGSAFIADFLPNDGRPGLYLTASRPS